MNLLIKSGSQHLEGILKKIDHHNVIIEEEITEKNISNSDCLIILSSLKNCSDPEELNLKIQDIYNTLSLCVEEGINKVIMVSSMEVFNYDENYTVTERWKVTPKKDFFNLSINLSEIVFKEFGRTFPFQKILLRVGFPLENKPDYKNEFSCFTKEDDFINSISRILKINFKNQFEIFHLQSESSNQRYLTKKLNELESLSSSISDHFYHPRGKKL
jgi:hypothetical protein